MSRPQEETWLRYQARCIRDPEFGEEEIPLTRDGFEFWLDALDEIDELTQPKEEQQ